MSRSMRGSSGDPDRGICEAPTGRDRGREKELENVRRAAKLLPGERGDPHIDKKVLGVSVLVVPD
jgi:hypothetical protein